MDPGASLPACEPAGGVDPGTALIFCGVCALTIAAYSNSLSGWFLYEDSVLPERTDLVRGLVRWSHEATRAFWGEGPRPARVVNLFWHLLNGALLWRLARHVVTTAAALFAAGVFLLHPVQTESVAYLASRPELIAAFWLLLACLAASRGWLWASAACAALTLTGKEMGVMAWLLVPLWAWVSGQTWTEKARELWATAAIAMLALFAVAVVERGFWQLMPWTFYGAQLAALWRLLLLMPEALVNATALTLDHDWSWMTRAGAFIALIGTAALIERAIRYSRLMAFALLWTLVALLPRLIVPMPDNLHERHLYTPVIALSLLMGAALFPQRTDARRIS